MASDASQFGADTLLHTCKYLIDTNTPIHNIPKTRIDVSSATMSSMCHKSIEVELDSSAPPGGCSITVFMDDVSIPEVMDDNNDGNQTLEHAAVRESPTLCGSSEVEEGVWYGIGDSDKPEGYDVGAKQHRVRLPVTALGAGGCT